MAIIYPGLLHESVTFPLALRTRMRVSRYEIVYSGIDIDFILFLELALAASA